MTMKEYAYNYSICNQPDEDIFHRQCAALVKYIPGLEPERLLQDVDGTLIQIYHHRRGDLLVWNDMQVGGVYIESDFDIEPYFE